MGLSTGTRLEPYEILSSLAAGGVGAVYRARDTRLERTVVVKVLNSNLSINSEVKQRFRSAHNLRPSASSHLPAL
jgi:eukaryotic-like serine/threonine-protein kinase